MALGRENRSREISLCMNETNTPAPVSLWSACSAPELLNLLADGAYITDADRKILFWNRAAERITGWTAEEVVGRTCRDNILVHVDKDGHRLCGREYCPLHRSMVTGQPSQGAVLVFAQNKAGGRTPVEVTVAPLRNEAGQIIGGIELFRDLTESMEDQLRAKKIQEITMQCDLARDDRVSIETRYQPCDLVGGDFYRVEWLGGTRYAILLADAMGHGVSAALYTMLLRSLWDDHRGELGAPARFMQLINNRAHLVLQEGAGYFGTALYVNYDAATGELHCVRAGHPPALLFRAGGAAEFVGAANPALGMFTEVQFRETVTRLEANDTLLLFTDGATEVFDAQDQQLGIEGLSRLVGEQTQGAPAAGLALEKLEEQLLRYSNQIRLPDDLTLVKLVRRR